jgi:hypothetical protein
MNFYVWCKPPAADIDAIEKLGNPGWNFKYSLMTETHGEISPSTTEHAAGLPCYVPIVTINSYPGGTFMAYWGKSYYDVTVHSLNSLQLPLTV